MDKSKREVEIFSDSRAPEDFKIDNLVLQRKKCRNASLLRKTKRTHIITKTKLITYFFSPFFLRRGSFCLAAAAIAFSSCSRPLCGKPVFFEVRLEEKANEDGSYSHLRAA